jgi:hypothetical protein
MVMESGDRIEALLELAERIGLTVRREPLGGEGGGFCLLKGRRVLFVDTLADEQTRWDKTLQALASLPDLDRQYIRPDLREALEKARPQSGIRRDR